ncbi:Enhancer of mRNA-decapping protein 4 [Chionoecetes opilio]|uniref:Enhancer of mRNA-decapping protein 4 n=1 Tax=Chionoecetes opilio TaxID=41210 RepID=A0A8J4Y1J9_CHIOP|nr:Enhancer of mRNA-decapping protein 4 [Chionoecetes opilio]
MESAGYEETAVRHKPILSNSPTSQCISFGASEERWSSVVVGTEVQVEVGATSHTSGSSAITTRSISNYSWDHHYLSGSLVAQHSSGGYVAYAIRGECHEGYVAYAIRGECQAGYVAYAIRGECHEGYVAYAIRGECHEGYVAYAIRGECHEGYVAYAIRGECHEGYVAYAIRGECHEGYVAYAIRGECHEGYVAYAIRGECHEGYVAYAIRGECHEGYVAYAIRGECHEGYVAYAIRAPQKTSGMVRIINNKTGDRGLIRNIRGMVRDLAFAHITNRIILAFTDQFGTLYVCEVTETSTGTSLKKLDLVYYLDLSTEILVEVASSSNEASDHHRIIWCPYIPDEQAGGEEGDEPAHLLVLTHGPCAEIWNISVVLREHGGGQLRRDQVASGYQLMEQHSAPITDAAFSPDGTALATAALDGYVKFFQVYMADEEKSPRCLHQWNPHDGKPLSALFFLDDHKHHSPDVQFWKYAVTGACNNSELRVWSCESWQCHQTLRFVPTRQDPPQTPLVFKATMDPSANFLLLSDIHRRVMYVIVVYQDGNSGGGGGGNSISGGISGGNCCLVKNSGDGVVDGIAQLVSVSELPVQYPGLFLSITDAAWKPYKRWKHDHMHDAAQNPHDDEDMESPDMVDGVVLRCVLINTVSLQEATLRFKPDTPLPGPLTHHHDLSVSRDSIGVRDGMTDLSLSTSVSEVDTGVSGEREDGEEEQPPPPPPPPDALTSPGPQSSGLPSQHSTPAASQASPPMTLLTPDSFSSPRRPEDSDLPEEDNDEGSVSNKVTPNKYDADFENAALSLLLRCGSGTLMQSSDSESSSSLKILGSVVTGSCTTPPATSLPPPALSTPRPEPFQDKDGVPLATSEVVVASTGGVGRTGASTTSSPSLEVQQILHSQNGKNEEFVDEDDEDPRARDKAGMAEDEEEGDDEDEEEEDEEDEGEEDEDEPEAHRQPSSSHGHPPQPQQPPEHQTLTQSSATTIVKPTTSLPQPLTPVIVKPKPPTSLPQPPTPLPQPPLPQPPLSLPEQSPSSSSQTQSAQQASPSLPRPPPSSLPPVPPLSLPQSLPPSLPPPLSAASQAASSLPPGLNTLAQLAQKHGHDLELPKTPTQPLDLFASVRSLPTQLTCAQLEAEIKAGSVSPETAASPAIVTLQGSPSQAKNGHGYNIVGRPAESPAADHHNGPVTPAVTAEDVAELRSLMMGCVSMTREQGQAAVVQARSLAAKLDKTLHHMTQLTKQVEEVKSAQSQIQMELPRALAASLRPVVEGTLRNELRTVVLPGVVKSLEPLGAHLSQEVRSLTKSSEAQVLDGLTKVIHSKPLIDGIVGSVGTAVTSTVQSSCRDAYNKLLLPGLNALTQQIFAQVNENFSRGTREYLQNVENEVQGGRTAVQDTMGKVSQSLNTACSSLAAHSKTLQDNVGKLLHQQNTLSDSLSERIRGMVREEVAHALQEHQASVDARSRAHTPGPAPHTLNPKVAQQQVQVLISQGQFNTAFKQALSASDLSLVMFVCERVNPQQVFNMTPCPLSQDVLLSLVNQLSHDLSTFTELKLKYLEEAIMNLDSSHPVTREHMRSVLQGFQLNINVYLMANPNHKKVKMLLMAVNHLVTS